MENDAQTFRDEWRAYHKDIPPTGWALRESQSAPWVRYHALPDSKQYSEGDSERATILARANAIGDRLLGDGSPCWWVEARIYDLPGAGALAGEFQVNGDPDEPVWHFYVRPVEWKAGRFDDDFTAIADEKLMGLWMCRSNGVVFAPYDGGFDLFPPSFGDVEILKTERPDWLSSEPSGL